MDDTASGDYMHILTALLAGVGWVATQGNRNERLSSGWLPEPRCYPRRYRWVATPGPGGATQSSSTNLKSKPAAYLP